MGHCGNELILFRFNKFRLVQFNPFIRKQIKNRSALPCTSEFRQAVRKPSHPARYRVAQYMSIVPPFTNQREAIGPPMEKPPAEKLPAGGGGGAVAASAAAGIKGRRRRTEAQ